MDGLVTKRLSFFDLVLRVLVVLTVIVVVGVVFIIIVERIKRWWCWVRVMNRNRLYSYDMWRSVKAFIRRESIEGSSLLPHRYDSELIRSNSALSKLNPIHSMSDLIDTRLGSSDAGSFPLRKHESKRKHMRGKKKSVKEESGIRCSSCRCFEERWGVGGEVNPASSVVCNQCSMVLIWCVCLQTRVHGIEKVSIYTLHHNRITYWPSERVMLPWDILLLCLRSEGWACLFVTILILSYPQIQGNLHFGDSHV